jgi:alkaline phosphatase D
MLGTRQEEWLRQRARSGERWTVLANQVMVAELDHDRGTEPVHWQDSWDGYPVARNRLLQDLQRAGVRNTFVATGDWHSTFVNDIHLDFEAPSSPVVATEIIAPAITSNGDGPYYGPMIPANPHIKFFDGDRKGYVRCAMTPRELRADLRYVEYVGRERLAPIETFASFVVRDGVPGAQRV